MNATLSGESIRSFQPVLFGSNKCACGTDFDPAHKAQKHCSSKCRNAAHHKEKDRKLKERADAIKAGFPVPELKLSPKDLEAASLHARHGLTYIANQQGRSKQAVRRSLIRAGIYIPDERFSNDPTKPGVNAIRRAKERAKTAEKQKEAREYVRQERVARRRNIVAKILRGMRLGGDVEQICHANGWPTNSVWNWVRQNPWYFVLRKRRGSLPSSLENYAKNKRLGWTSTQFASESVLCDSIGSTLETFGESFEREKKCQKSRCRVDFFIPSRGLYVEAKLTTKGGAFDRAIGQIARYRTIDKVSTWLVIPDDVRVRDDQNSVVLSLGARVVRLSELRKLLAA